jgi:hypothetical protein
MRWRCVASPFRATRSSRKYASAASGRTGDPNNLARAMRFLPLLAEVEQGIVRCFREGGGLSYADYPRFHAVMGEDGAAVVDATLLNRTVPLVERLDARLRAGIDVADIGCGSGHAINVLARATRPAGSPGSTSRKRPSPPAAPRPRHGD